MTIEKAIEKAARAGYEKFFEGVGELEPQWHELPLEHQFRLMQSQIAAIAAFLREAEATEGMTDNARGPLMVYLDKGYRPGRWTVGDHMRAAGYTGWATTEECDLTNVTKAQCAAFMWRAMSSRLADDVEGGGR